MTDPTILISKNAAEYLTRLGWRRSDGGWLLYSEGRIIAREGDEAWHSALRDAYLALEAIAKGD